MRLFILISLLLFSLEAKDEYQLGKGVQLGSIPFYLGGYFSLDYKHTDDMDRYRVDDLAILGYGNYEKFSYIAEFEFKEFYVKTSRDGLSKSTTNDKLYTERLYIDYNIDENYMLRAGKYNSPIGFWNLLPINVLRETTSNPITSSILFPKFTTGLNASYLSYDDGELKIDVMLQHNRDISSGYNNYKIDKHYGFGISYEKDDYTFKLNSGYFHNTIDVHDNDLYYILFSAKYESDKFQILTELGSQRSKSRYTTDYAGYVQSLYRFTQQHLGIVRVESYEDSLNTIDDNILIIGYTYRPLYPIAFKTEYQFHSKNSQNNLLLSFSVLF